MHFNLSYERDAAQVPAPVFTKWRLQEEPAKNPKVFFVNLTLIPLAVTVSGYLGVLQL